jgi:transposase
MTVDEVLAKVRKARTLNIQPMRGGHCAVCYKHAARAVSIHEPQGEVIPLCQAHLDEIEEAVQEAIRKASGTKQRKT